MSWLAIARLAGFAAVGAALAALVWLAADRFDQKAIADAAEACEKAAPTPADDLGKCGPNVAARVAADRTTVVCEGALFPELRDETRFTASQACGPGAKRLIAQGDAEAAEIASLKTALDKVTADTAAAVSRAEERGRAEQTRKNNARQIIDDAPRSADGRIACDADCLRHLAN